MSAAAVLSDDTNNIVDAALARVREDAHLDAEPVLPPLELLLPIPLRRRPPPLPPSATPRVPESGIVVVPTPVPLPSAEAIVAQVAKKNAPTVVVPKETQLAARPSIRWPILLCGFIACVFAGAAFMRSPIGQRPRVQHAVTVAKSHVASAYAATKHATRDLLDR